MKYLTEADAITELENWQGADATVVEYRPALSRIVIRLNRLGDERALCVGLVGCESYCGPLRWTNAQLALEPGRMLDRTNGVTVVHGGFALALVDAGETFPTVQE